MTAKTAQGGENITGLVAVGVLGYLLFQAMNKKDEPPPDQSNIMPGAQILAAPSSSLSVARAGGIRASANTTYPPGALLQLVAYIKNTSKWDSGPNQGEPAPFTFYQLNYTVWEGSVLPGHGALLRNVLNSQALTFAEGESLAVYSDIYTEVKGTIDRRDVGLTLYDVKDHAVATGEWDDVYYVQAVPASVPSASFFTSPVAVQYSGLSLLQQGGGARRRPFGPWPPMPVLPPRRGIGIPGYRM